MEKRREELENFLKVISQHSVLRNDSFLHAFLAFQDEEFQNYVTNPSKFEKVIEIVKAIPNLQNLTLGSIQDAVHSSIVNVTHELYSFEEPRIFQMANSD